MRAGRWGEYACMLGVGVGKRMRTGHPGEGEHVHAWWAWGGVAWGMGLHVIWAWGGYRQNACKHAGHQAEGRGMRP